MGSGYGSPSGYGLPSGWGYGSPTPSLPWNLAEADPGYGSPSITIAPVIQGQTATTAYADDGGAKVVLLAAWVDSGPYYVRLVDVDGNLFPALRNTYSGVIGQADACYPDPTKESLSFILPPASPGVYSIRLRYGPNAALEILISGALRIVRRSRSAETYRLRTQLPPIYNCGPRSARQEPAFT